MLTIRRISFGLLLVLVLPNSARALQAGPAVCPREVAPLVEIREGMQHEGVPGISLAVLREGRIAAVCTFGFANVRTAEPVAESTLFEAASLTKPVYALAVLRLADREFIDLDRPLTSYAPDEAFAYDERYRRVTARMILQHTSGLPNELPPPDGRLRLLFDPGSRFSYSGDAFLFLQQIVERITGVPTGPWLQAELRRFGMTESAVAWNDSLADRLARGHQDDGTVAPLNEEAKAYACCSLLTTARDYAAFLAALYEGRIVPSRFADEYLKATVVAGEGIGWALGWATEAREPDAAVWHWGHSPRPYRSFVWFDPEDGAGLVFLSNSSNGLALTQLLLDAVAPGEHPLIEWFDYPQYNPANTASTESRGAARASSSTF